MPTLRAAGAVFGFGILVIVLGLFVAPMVGATSANAQQSFAIQDGQSKGLHPNANISATIDNQNDAVVTITDTTTFAENSTSELDPGENDTITVSGSEFFVEYDDFSQGGEYGIFTVEYPSAFQYGDGVKLFINHTGLILTLLGMLIAIFGLVIGVRLA